jgi:hypothetical protein
VSYKSKDENEGMMKTTKTQAEETNSRKDGTNRTVNCLLKADVTTALIKSRMALLETCIGLQDICSEMGLPLSHVAENCKRSIRENVNSIIERLRKITYGTYVAGLLDYVEDATKDLLYLDRCILDHKLKAGKNFHGQDNMASAFRKAAIDDLRSVLKTQLVDWDGADVEALRRIRIDLCRIGMADSDMLGGVYDEATGLEVLAEDKLGRQLVVIVREPEECKTKNLALVKSGKRKA